MANYESPDYKVVEKEGNLELRTYESFSLIKYTSVNDPYADGAFQTLFKYIQGDNESKATIAMTVPVFQDFLEHGITMSFVVPQKYWVGIPKPNHPDLKIVDFEAGLYAVVRFKGSQSIRNMRQHQTELLVWLKKKDLSLQSDLIGAFYNPPFMPPFLRRNELMVRVKRSEE